MFIAAASHHFPFKPPFLSVMAMEAGFSYEQKTLISELIQGANYAKQLKSNLNSPENREMLIQGILSSYEKALLILKCHPRPIPESPLSSSVNGSPLSQDFDKGAALPKKRKMLPTWSDQVRINPETGLEGPHDDGHSWRKYGQKDILGAKHPRSYYRCTYRNTHNCCATKQVQRSDEDPTVFEVTYKGQHSCINGGGGSSTPTPTSPEKLEPNQDPLTRFKTGLRVETDNLNSSAMEMPCPPLSFPPSFGNLKSDFTNPNPNLSPSPYMSPSTPESSYFSHYPIHVFGQPYNPHYYESDLTGIVSATTSATNSPLVDLDLQLEAVGIDPSLLFDTNAFFP